MTIATVLHARKLCKTYPGGDTRHAVIDALDLDVAAGEIVAVIGRSGSGKSTLLNLAGQMDTPDAGCIRCDGIDTATWDDERRTRFRRRQVGFVFQAYNLLPTLTVRENIALPLELNGLPFAPRLDTIIDALDLGTLAARYPDQISGGEQQRAAIARALVHAPPLVIADEPTGNLDQETACEVIALFEHAVREAGAALLMATHSLEMVGHADRVLRLRHGRLVAANE
ncbi:MAG: ABC transporter ATP-binding protein [Gammaproteobacteria bacterium]